ncbi:hypothetical protein JKP88DRAFT_286735 [Tribonema minus]|uniref:Replication origin-binding protein domain-containing protein n=1 Tax=Tribonema minus TaxID=303371 RepID=A0A836CN43_9STRA|nr:hypothetical protein JKP88DRAFT_286735 [Tribonema minus]
MSPTTLPQLLPLELHEPAYQLMVEFLLHNRPFVDAVMGSAPAGAYTFRNINDMHSKGCWRRVPYAFAHKAHSGRLYVRTRPGVQALKKIIRNLVLRGITRDWDITNCHPTLLAQLCHIHGIECPLLEEYVALRGDKLELLARTAIDLRTGQPLALDAAKACYLAMLNGGGRLYQSTVRVCEEVDGKWVPMVDISDPWVISFYKEVQRIGARIAALFTVHAAAAGKNDGAWNANGKCVSRVLGEVESGILRVMFEFCGANNITVFALMFDGLMTGLDVSAELGLRMAAAVRERTGYVVAIVEKEIEDVDMRVVAAELGVELERLDLYDRARTEQTALLEGQAQAAAPPTCIVHMDDNVTMLDSVPPPLEPEVDMAYLERGANGQLYLRHGIFCELAAKFVLCRAGMAMGKTEQMLHLIQHCIDQGWGRIVIVTQRRTMVDAAMSRVGGNAAEVVYKEAVDSEVPEVLVDNGGGGAEQEEETAAVRRAKAVFGFKRYDQDASSGDGTIDLAQAPRVVVEYESLQRLRGAADLVIIDETRSLCTSFISKTNGKDGSLILTNFTALQDLVVCARKVLCMDADLTFDGCVAQWVSDMARICMDRQAALLDAAAVRYKQLALMSAATVDRERTQLARQQLPPRHPQVDVYRARIRSEVIERERAMSERERCIMRAHEMRTAEELVLDVSLDGTHPAGWLPSGDAQLVPAAFAIDVSVHKLQRRIIMMDTNSVLARAKELACGGARIAIMAGSKEEAKTWADVLRPLCSDDYVMPVGLYVGDGNLTAGSDVNELWDRHQVIIYTSTYTTGADYQGDVHTTGLHRDVLTAMPTSAIHAAPLTRDDLDERQRNEYNLMLRGRQLLTRSVEFAKNYLVYSADPTAVHALTLPPTPTPLLNVASCVRAEDYYKGTPARCGAMLKYICAAKGYEVVHDDSQLSKKEVTALRAEKQASTEVRKRAWQEALGGVDALPFVAEEDATPEQRLQADAEFHMLQQFLERVGLEQSQAGAALERATAARVLGVGAASVTAEQVQSIIKRAPVLECHELFECITSGGDDTPLLQDMLHHYCGAEVSPPELRTAHPFVKLHWCDTLVRALGADSLGDSKTPIIEADVDRSWKVAEVLSKMRALNITKAFSDSNFKAAATVLNSILDLKLTDAEPLALGDEVSRLLQLRAQRFNAATWFCARNADAAPPMRDQYRPLPGMARERLDHILQLYSGITVHRYAAVAQQAAAARIAPHRVVGAPYRRRAAQV